MNKRLLGVLGLGAVLATGAAAAFGSDASESESTPPRNPIVKLDAASSSSELGAMPADAFERVAGALPRKDQVKQTGTGVLVTKDDLPSSNTGEIRWQGAGFTVSSVELTNGSVCVDTVREDVPQTTACIHDLGDSGANIGWHQRPDRSYVTGVVADGIDDVTIVLDGRTDTVEVVNNTFVWEAAGPSFPYAVVFEYDGEKHRQDAPPEPGPTTFVR